MASEDPNLLYPGMCWPPRDPLVDYNQLASTLVPGKGEELSGDDRSIRSAGNLSSRGGSRNTSAKKKKSPPSK